MPGSTLDRRTILRLGLVGAFFFPDGKRFIYASTHLGSPACPPPPDRSRGYAWPIYPTYEIFSSDLDGGRPTRLTDNEGYDAEGAVSPDGSRIVFTSLRDGDLDVYLMDADGSNVRRLTDRPGYDGGPFFSWDGRFIVFRAARPETREELEEYRALLKQSLVRPQRLEIFVMKGPRPSRGRRPTPSGASSIRRCATCRLLSGVCPRQRSVQGPRAIIRATCRRSSVATSRRASCSFSWDSCSAAT